MTGQRKRPEAGHRTVTAAAAAEGTTGLVRVLMAEEVIDTSESCLSAAVARRARPHELARLRAFFAARPPRSMSRVSGYG